MKVLQITTSSKGGAGLAAKRLHKALRENGIASAYISKDLSIDFDGNTFVDPFFQYKKPAFLQRVLRKLRSLIVPTSAQQMWQKIESLNKALQYEMLSLPFSNYELHHHPLVQEANILNLHLVSGILDYKTFFEQCKKPLVWTLHDMNPFLGLFHYRGDDLINREVIGSIDIHCRQIKTTAIKRIETGALITPSQWLLEEAKTSSVFEHFRIKRSISNAIGLDVFKLQNRELLRKEKQISPEEFVLLFVSEKLDNHRKGIDLLQEALTGLSYLPLTVLTVGEGQIKGEFKNLKIVPLGRVSGEEEMARCYGKADVFVLPSREDNLPNVMLESFACGTPVVSFAIGGMKEHIKNNFNGYLAEEMTGESLAEAIIKVYENRTKFDPGSIRAYAKENFSFQKQAKAYTLTYSEILKQDNIN